MRASSGPCSERNGPTRRSRRSWGPGGLVELGDGLRVRHTADGELTAHWPDAARLVPESFGRETDRLCVLELERPLPAAGGEPPDARGRSPMRSPRFASRRVARSRPGRFSSSAWTGDPSASGRCYRSPRRNLQASRLGSMSFAARSRLRCWPSSGRRSTIASWATRSTAGSSRSSRPPPSVPSSCALLWGSARRGDGAWAALSEPPSCWASPGASGGPRSTCCDG